MGNVKGGPAFTHISYDDYCVVRANFLEGKTASIKGRLVPYTVFTDPQLGRVGITEAEARSKSMDIEIVKMAMSHVAHALEVDFLQERIREACAKALRASDPECQEVLRELRKLLHEHSETLRKLAADNLGNA